MANNSELAKIYETLLTIPGMNEAVKISLKIPRKNVLLLNQVIERGLLVKAGEEGSGVIAVNKEATAAIQQIADELLEKSGLAEMKEKLNTFQQK